MIKLIDRYIIGKFLGTYFFMLGIIMLLAVVFDISEKLSEFIDNQAPFSEILLNYYMNFVLFYGNMFSSMIIFISVIWFTAKMAQETEIIPIWFSGRPISRFIRPYFLGATVLMILSLILNHLVIPRANKVRLEFEEKYYRDRMHIEEYHAEFPGNEIVYFSSYGSEDNLINEFVVEKWGDDKKIKHFIKARTAKNITGTNRWILNDYYERHVGYPNDQLIQKHQKDTTFQFTIEDMAQRDNIAEAMTFTQLTKHIDRERKKGSSKVPYFEIELHQRTSYPFAAYILTIIGVAVSSQKKRGGIGMNIAIGLGIVFIYIFVMKVATVSTIKIGFPAVVAVWIPNMIFAVVALFMYRFAQK